jgi:hypothetical protein
MHKYNSDKKKSSATKDKVNSISTVEINNAEIDQYNVPPYNPIQMDMNTILSDSNTPIGEVTAEEEHNIIIKAQPQFQSTDPRQLDNIRDFFNSSDRCNSYNRDQQGYDLRKPSIMTKSGLALFKHRRLNPQQMRIVQENNIPELVTHKQGVLRRVKRVREIGNPNYTSSTAKIFNLMNEGIYGHSDRFIAVVGPGNFAKTKMGSRYVLLDEGVHVIKQPVSYTIDPRSKKANVFVTKNSNLIQHENITRVRIPNGYVCCYKYNTEHQFLRSREKPYLFNENVAKIMEGNDNNILFDANAPYLTFGSLERYILRRDQSLMVGNKEYKAVWNDSNVAKEIIINNPRANPELLSRALQNINFPSEETIIQNKKDKKEHPELDHFYTSDSIKVGVKIFVCYRIVDPLKLMSFLKLSDVQTHIEGVVATDMGRIFAGTKAQDLMASDSSTLKRIEAPKKGQASAPILFSNYKDAVKQQVYKDLDEIGIELVRLELLETVILQKDIADAMAKPATQSAKARADASVVKVQGMIAKQQAEQKNAINAMKTQQENELIVSQAEAKSSAMLIEAKAKLEAAKIENKIAQMKADRERESKSLLSKVYQDSPELFELAKMNILSQAMQGSHFSSAIPMSDMSQLIQSMCHISQDKNTVVERSIDQRKQSLQSVKPQRNTDINLSAMTNVAFLASQMPKAPENSNKKDSSRSATLSS